MFPYTRAFKFTLLLVIAAVCVPSEECNQKLVHSYKYEITKGRYQIMDNLFIRLKHCALIQDKKYSQCKYSVVQTSTCKHPFFVLISR